MGLDVLRVVLEDLPVQVDGFDPIAAQGQSDRMFASVFAGIPRAITVCAALIIALRGFRFAVKFGEF